MLSGELRSARRSFAVYCKEEPVAVLLLLLLLLLLAVLPPSTMLPRIAASVAASAALPAAARFCAFFDNTFPAAGCSGVGSTFASDTAVLTALFPTA